MSLIMSTHNMAIMPDSSYEHIYEITHEHRYHIKHDSSHLQAKEYELL